MAASVTTASTTTESPPAPAGGMMVGSGDTDAATHRKLPRLGLRTRVILAFSIGALFLALVLSGLVITLTRTNLINQREASASQQVAVNARSVRSQLSQAPDGAVLGVLESLQTPDGSRPSLYLSSAAVDGEPGSGWSAPDPQYGQNALPPALRQAVLSGHPAKMRFIHQASGDKSLAIGTPIAEIGGAYFEIASLEPIDDTLTSISFTLFGASAATVLAGAAFGWYSSRRILRPLGEVGIAARALAGGALDTRIRTLVDPDLEPIVTSFNGMADTLATRIEKDAQFASDVSHELRSPLMTLQASIEVLENNRADLSERAQSALDLLSEDLDRFRELVEDLLEISRFDAGVMDLDLQEVMLSEFVRYAIREAGYSVPVLMAPTVEVDPEFGDIITALDKRRIARVLANLLGNAEKYGEGPSRVVIDADDEMVRIMVDDSGPGVPVEDRSRIFERFNRAGAANRRGVGTGVGLGLALVAEHVRLHEGGISVDDAPGGGARFVISLPRRELDHDLDDVDLSAP